MLGLQWCRYGSVCAIAAPEESNSAAKIKNIPCLSMGCLYGLQFRHNTITRFSSSRCWILSERSGRIVEKSPEKI